MQSSDVPAPQPNPAVRFLKVSANGQDAYLVLGFVDRDAVTGQPVEVWYSADKEALRLSNGRLVSLTSTPTEWYTYHLPSTLPAWRDVNAPVAYPRERDQMPGYRIGLVEQIQLRSAAAPRQSRLSGYPATQLTWFEETGGAYGAARFALYNGRPIYGEQCLSASLCVTWQPWPPEPTAP